MKVVFFEDVEGTANVGDVKDVKNGFARNFLLPRSIAGATTKENLQRANSLAQKEARRQERLDQDATKLVARIGDLKLTIEARVGETGRLFGSVTNRDIAERVNAATEVGVDPHIVMLQEPIRELGTRQVTIRFTRNIQAEVTVEVVPDEASKPVVAKFLAEKEATEKAEADRLAALQAKAAADAEAAALAAMAEEEAAE